ncbi:phasin family protein [Microvirga yunnanensis]|uniref:phasin family protein n=1 Tax=Microvirga yunnanensis TaxID=2953740 RepID=UPI0021C6261D|nr:phasin family protein [Microvirga sp. HBU65207]
MLTAAVSLLRSTNQQACLPNCAYLSLAFFHPLAGSRLTTAAGSVRSMMPDPLSCLRGMMINRTIGQTPPDKANELIAQLLGTANDAAETREQLLASLAHELYLLANLQEQHLFPVLENHPETADLVREARDDNQQTRALLDELAATPKDSDTFLPKVEELRKVFQQHIRNDKNELLPVVLKVLNEEEVEAVVEKVEEEIAEATRAAGDQPVRRPRAKRTPRTSGNLLAAVEAIPEATQDIEQEIQATAQASLPVAAEIVDRAIEVTGVQGQVTSNLLDHAPRYLQAVARSNRILARGTGTIALEWFGLRQERLLKNLDGMNELLGCRSIPDLVSLQSSLIRQNVEQMIGNSQRLAQISAQVAQEATQTIMSPTADRPIS